MPNDEDDDELETDERVTRNFPGGVMAAGIIWIGIGALQLLGSMFNLASLGANQQAGAQGAPGASSGICCGFLIGLAFLYCGVQTVTGKAKDTLGNSIGSLLLGTLEVVAGIALAILVGALAGAGGNAQFGAGIAIIIGAIVGIFGSILILAGILGLVGRKGYLDWRAENAPGERNRRRRRRVVEEDDEDDEEDPPRRRRPRRDDDD